MADRVMRMPMGDGMSPMISNVGGGVGAQRESSGYEQGVKDKKTIRRQETGMGSALVPDGVAQRLTERRGQGNPLPPELNTQIGDVFQQDFSDVRLHTDAEAIQMSQDLNAHAFTYKNDIYFNSGKYQPETVAGRGLIGHELTHTLQQGQNKVKRQDKKKTQGGKVVNKNSKTKKDLSKASPGELTSITPHADGYIEITDTGKVKEYNLYLHNFRPKGYLWKKDLENLQVPHKLPKSGERKNNPTQQVPTWKTYLRNAVSQQLSTIIGASNNKAGNKYLLSLKTGVGYAGTFDQILDKILIPFWDINGKPRSFQVEHMVDYQLAGRKDGNGNLAVDNIENLILLDARINMIEGGDMNKTINDHIYIIANHYNKNGIQVGSIRSIRKNFNISVESYDLSQLKNEDMLPDYLWYFREEMMDESYPGNPYNLIQFDGNDHKRAKNKDKISLSVIDDSKNDYFVLVTNPEKAGIMVYGDTQKSLDVGAFSIEVNWGTKKDNSGKDKKTISSIVFTHKKLDQFNVVTTNKKLNKNKEICEEVTDNPVVPGKTYKLKDGANKRISSHFAEFIIGIKGMSPIVIKNAQFDEFNFTANGKIVPDLSIFSGLDIDFMYDNGHFTAAADILANKLTQNIPKPFNVNYSKLSIYASSLEGLNVFGSIGFNIPGFGEGDLTASSDQKGSISFSGAFDFDNKYFKPASIKISYQDNKWSIFGEIGLKADTIKGIKQATLNVNYNSEEKKLNVSGEAFLKIPGVSKISLATEIGDSGAFMLKADTTLDELPGIKAGSTVGVTLYSAGDGIKLGMRGKAQPDIPSIPELNSELEISYEDGIFNARAFVKYQKGRFGGAVEIGVTNKTVNEKGEPQSETTDDKTTIYGFGKLKVELFKGITGEVTVRLTPESELLAGGKIAVEKGLMPFGPGTEFTHPLGKIPTIKIPLIGIPGFSLYCKIEGGAFFYFKWLPLQIEELQVAFQETNIHEIENTVVEIIGKVSSIATAESYLKITATIGAEAALIAKLEASLTGKAGIRVNAFAGGAINAEWGNEKGLILKEIMAYVNVSPEAFYELVGKLRIYLDLWLTTVTLYSKQWKLASGQADLGALNLMLGFPIRFDESGSVILPTADEIVGNSQMPDLAGKDGKTVMDGSLNADAKREREETKLKLKNDIENEILTNKHKKGFSPSKYEESLLKKYKKDAEMQAFISSAVHDVAKRVEYEEFYQFRAELLSSEKPLEDKSTDMIFFRLFRWLVDPADYAQLRSELIAREESKRLANSQTVNDQNNSKGI